MERWQQELHGDPLPWLLEPDNPAVRHMTLRLLLDRGEHDEETSAARQAAMHANPIATILEHQHPDGYWVKSGPGYTPKYTSTVWSAIILDQLGADGEDPRISLACDYILSHTQTEVGGFGASGQLSGRARPSSAIHCLNGNLLRALIGFGRLDDPRLKLAIDWQARSITGDAFDHYYRSGTAGPGFACAANDGLPCAWGAVKALRGLARIPDELRAPHVQAAIQQGLAFLLSRDPAVADYPTSTHVSSSWFKLGFPSGYVADVLQVFETLAELGHAKNPHLSHLVEWVLAQQDEHGRWRNRYAYHRKMWVDIERQGQPSKWVTLRACHALKQALA